MKISSYLLGLGAVAGLMALTLTPASAQLVNGSDNGNTFTSVTNVGGGGIVGGGQPGYAAQSQSAIDQFSQSSVNANSLGDPATFDTINGGSTAPLVATLLPTGIAPDGATSKAAVTLATTVQGLRSSDGKINASKLNASVPAYNDYVKALVGEVGPENAVNNAPAGQKALQGLLSQLVQIANQAAPAPAPDVAPPAPPAPPAPGK